MIHRRLTATAVSGVLVLALAACGGGAKTTTFTVQQGKPHLASMPVKEGGATMGDLVAFVAPVTRDNSPAGTISGTLIAVDLPGDGIGEEELQSRVANVVFRFSQSDSITVAGSGVYPVAADEIAVSRPMVRAITGGTGAYIGARGQVTSVRNDDGTYAHTFELLP